MADKRDPAAADRRPAGQDASARCADYAFDLKRRLEAAVEGDPARLRAIARRARRKLLGYGAAGFEPATSRV